MTDYHICDIVSNIKPHMWIGGVILKVDKTKVQLKMAKMGFNQLQLAEHTGVSRQTISCIMNGRECRPELFGRIAKALKTEPEDIIKQ